MLSGCTPDARSDVANTSLDAAASLWDTHAATDSENIICAQARFVPKRCGSEGRILIFLKGALVPPPGPIETWFSRWWWGGGQHGNGRYEIHRD